MFKRIYEEEELRKTKRQCLQDKLEALSAQKRELKAAREKLLLSEKEVQDELKKEKPLSPAVLALMKTLETATSTGEFAICKLAESHEAWSDAHLQEEIPPELRDKCILVQHKFGAWVFTCLHDDKCATCRYDEPNIIDVEYTGPDAEIGCEWFDGTFVAFDVSYEDISLPDHYNVPWELIDIDQSVGDAFTHALFAIYRK